MHDCFLLASLGSRPLTSKLLPKTGASNLLERYSFPRCTFFRNFRKVPLLLIHSSPSKLCSSGLEMYFTSSFKTLDGTRQKLRKETKLTKIRTQTKHFPSQVTFHDFQYLLILSENSKKTFYMEKCIVCW